jgi:hypothetical protein
MGFPLLSVINYHGGRKHERRRFLSISLSGERDRPRERKRDALILLIA